MLYFPHAKVNLGLKILGKRPDGFHAIESIFLPIQICDSLEIIEASEFTFSFSGVDHIDGTNLCVKAYKEIAKVRTLPPVSMHLHKSIPIGAGMGGGSADASYTLTALNTQFKLKLSDEELFNFSLMLGSDCPFFLQNQPQYVTGRGEHMSPTTVDLKGYQMIVINPGIHISTGEAYKNLTSFSKTNETPLTEAIKLPIEQWKNHLVNDFEEYAFRKYPEIEKIKNTLYDKGASFASMTGTGSTVYGIFKKDLSLNFHHQYPDYFVRKAEL